MQESSINLLPFHQTPQGCALFGAHRWSLDDEHEQVPIGIQVTRSRLLPWLHVARIPRFGRGLPEGLETGLARSLARLAREKPVLRLHIEVWSEQPEERARVASALRAFGFERVEHPRSYTRTIWMELDRSEESLLAGFHATARRHIRAPAKRGYAVRPIVEPGAAPRVEQMFRDSFARTGARPRRVPWHAIIEAAAQPDASLKLVGLFPDTERSGLEPLSFALALLHGEVAEYSHAGSVRDPSVRVPLLYAPAWELMRWARERGARYWDFGGVVGADSGDDDALRGISDFKRYFSREERVVGEEWVMEPRRRAAEISALPRRLRTLGFTQLDGGLAQRPKGEVRSRAVEQERLQIP